MTQTKTNSCFALTRLLLLACACLLAAPMEEALSEVSQVSAGVGAAARLGMEGPGRRSIEGRDIGRIVCYGGSDGIACKRQSGLAWGRWDFIPGEGTDFALVRAGEKIVLARAAAGAIQVFQRDMNGTTTFAPLGIEDPFIVSSSPGVSYERPGLIAAMTAGGLSVTVTAVAKLATHKHVVTRSFDGASGWAANIGHAGRSYSRSANITAALLRAGASELGLLISDPEEQLLEAYKLGALGWEEAGPSAFSFVRTATGLTGRLNAIELLADGSIVAGGDFWHGVSDSDIKPAEEARYIARLVNGGWQPLGGGLNAEVRVLKYTHSKLFVGGETFEAPGLE